jgi:hypothetical protein
MKGGEISGNTAVLHGGGVGIFNHSTFTMQGGRIADNKASDHIGGGGIVIMSQGSFIMKGGVIENNKAPSGRGGGICIGTGAKLFTMTSGTIYGSDNAEKGNTATASNGGHVLYDARTSPATIVDTTITRYP